jgi:hypothetical protein
MLASESLTQVSKIEFAVTIRPIELWMQRRPGYNSLLLSNNFSFFLHEFVRSKTAVWVFRVSVIRV